MINQELAQRLHEIQESQMELREQSEELQRLMARQRSLEELMTRRRQAEEEVQQLTEAAEQSATEVQKKTIELDLAKAKQVLAELTARQNELEKELLMMTFIIQKNKKFDKTILFRNIRELLKSGDVKLGQIEKEAGVQAGYMSRLEKAGSTSDPSMEFVVTASKLLNVPIDLLINANIGAMTPTEEYMLKFIGSMIEDTRADDLTWKRETLPMLEKVEPSYDNRGTTTHPLFTYQRLYKNEEEYEDDIYYDSRFFRKETVRIIGTCYNAVLGGTNTKIYIMACKKGIAREQIDAVDYYEVYLIGKDIEPICCSLQTCDAVSQALASLYQEIEVAAAHVHLGIGARTIIGQYLEEREMPF